MGNEVTKIKGNAIAPQQQQQTSLPAGMDFTDLQPSNILLMQKGSEFVDQGKAKQGDIVDTLTTTIIGGEGKPVELIPLHMKKAWFSYTAKNGQKEKFRGIFQVSPENEHWTYQMEIDGQETLNFYAQIWNVLLADSPKSMPCVLVFKSTSLKSGKKLSTLVAQNHMKGFEPCEMSFLLSSIKKQGEKANYFVYEVTPSPKAVNPEAILSAKNWGNILSKKPIATPAIVDHGDD